MIRKVLPTFFTLVLFLPLSAWSQVLLTSSVVFDRPEASVQKPTPAQPEEEWSIYTDQESKTIYIDFEHISVNLNDIVVKDDEGRVVLEDKVFELPVNTIYEVDYQDYAPGRYEIELRSYTGVLKKSFQVK